MRTATGPLCEQLLTLTLSCLLSLIKIQELKQLVVFLDRLKQLVLRVEGKRGNSVPLLSEHFPALQYVILGCIQTFFHHCHHCSLVLVLLTLNLANIQHPWPLGRL